MTFRGPFQTLIFYDYCDSVMLPIVLQVLLAGLDCLFSVLLFPVLINCQLWWGCQAL